MDYRRKWFLDRIGKRVYRNQWRYCCSHCKDVYENGIVIMDKMHADYMADVEAEFTADGSPTRYFDTREEMLAYEKKVGKSDACGRMA